MRNRLGTTFMILGAVLVLASLSLFLWNRNEERKAGNSVKRILPQVIREIEDDTDFEDGSPSAPVSNDLAMTEEVIDGYAYVGYLSIPAIALELPVMSEWDYPRLKIAPCRYVGSTKTDNLVIAAHNYAYHFGTIKNLSPGDTVFFTDMDGIVSCYAVVTVEILMPTDIEDMTAGNYDLTLFTCTYGGKSRVTVRCDRTVRE